MALESRQQLMYGFAHDTDTDAARTPAPAPCDDQHLSRARYLPFAQPWLDASHCLSGRWKARSHVQDARRAKPCLIERANQGRAIVAGHDHEMLPNDLAEHAAIQSLGRLYTEERGKRRRHVHDTDHVGMLSRHNTRTPEDDRYIRVGVVRRTVGGV